ncbi:MAG: hypothetical protein K2N95_12600 [Lachnospiraceae bacterium]|nr:hypothetical protein [Lachnospiraceae bacterium]
MNGILYAQPIADVISAVITAFMALRNWQKQNNPKAEQTQSDEQWGH